MHFLVHCALQLDIPYFVVDLAVAEFELVVDSLLANVPELELATDIIAGFPGETQDVQFPFPSLAVLVSVSAPVYERLSVL